MDAEFQWEDFQTKNAKWARDIYDEEATFEPSIVFLTKDGEDVTVFVDQFIFSPRLLRKLIIHYISNNLMQWVMESFSYPRFVKNPMTRKSSKRV